VWLLARVLLFAIFDLVDQEDPHVQCWILCAEILHRTYLPSIDPASLPNLADLIERHHAQFKALYQANFTPKLHAATHLVSQTLRCASIIFLSARCAMAQAI
jgi:hypothetical protein